eukprot:gnl/MRDRNA2_/MRDRNA2_17008_c0_seq1.p1 gnl/MRDRNA2_/MRDRNA2_17008_c0~~gnl/MRDRNA2_/MRDRNA2_17008_c0_seq1.p1  ORF type:complete len:155 (+),score=53.18 gnl/MRDRNA2_/MRDRNA2_17008_c0_seq1:113-577(+)
MEVGICVERDIEGLLFAARVAGKDKDGLLTLVYADDRNVEFGVAADEVLPCSETQALASLTVDEALRLVKAAEEAQQGTANPVVADNDTAVLIAGNDPEAEEQALKTLAAGASARAEAEKGTIHHLLTSEARAEEADAALIEHKTGGSKVCTIS